jgi:hypothetical protein
LRLSDQHAVERVAVMGWKRAGLLRVPERQIQREETLLPEARFQIARRFELAEPPLDRSQPLTALTKTPLYASASASRVSSLSFRRFRL